MNPQLAALYADLDSAFKAQIASLDRRYRVEEAYDKAHELFIRRKGESLLAGTITGKNDTERDAAAKAYLFPEYNNAEVLANELTLAKGDEAVDELEVKRLLSLVRLCELDLELQKLEIDREIWLKTATATD